MNSVSVTRKRNDKTTKCAICGTKFRCLRRSARYCSGRCRVAALRRRRRRSVHFRSDSDDWGTPPDLFAELDREFHFELDVCASPTNAKCSRYFTAEDDGLIQAWSGVCWMNPPYGREIGRWVAKAHQTSIEGHTVVCLVPARTDTAWWHEYVTRAAEIRYLRGRLKFGTSHNSAPFPSAVIVFRRLGQQAA